MIHPFRQQLELSPSYPLWLLDKFLGHRARHRLLKIIAWILVFLILILILVWLASLWPVLGRSTTLLAPRLPIVVGLTLILFSLWSLVYLAEAFFRSRYFSAGDPTVGFEVGRLLFNAVLADTVATFLNSEIGEWWLARLGLPPAARDKFLAERKQKHLYSSLDPKSLVSLPVFVGALHDSNADFASWLLQFELKRSEAIGAARWAETARHRRRAAERWWTRDRLGRIPGLAKDWAYGESYLLNQYSLDLLTAPETNPEEADILWYSPAVRQAETILARAREANVLIAGPAGAPLEVIYELTKLIRLGRIFPALEGKHPKLLRTAILRSRFKDRQGLENELVRIFNEVVRAGNVILVIDDLPSFIAQAASLGADLPTLLDPYLLSPRVPVVALAETDGYQRVIEPNILLRERFETIQLAAADSGAAEERLLEAAAIAERRAAGRIFFTYPAVLALVRLGEQFAGRESAINQSLDLLLEIVPWALGEKIAVIGRDETLKFASRKLQVPLGAVGPEEREKLLKLEELLHQRIIGQDQAIVAIAGALRASRAGIRNLKRPLGSFLFLGPTGVGKTETAKALAEIFFGGADRLRRLDMSEYHGPEALTRLSGSSTSGEPGVLAKLLRTEPYGVLLLDEFEKTEPAVLNLFLQILDEGFFADMRGARVNARQILFIATSNAGAPLIWDLVGAGRRLIESEKLIIEAIVKQGIFKPELLNRFDRVIIFNPLGEAESLAVARLLLGRLADRLKERGLVLEITEAAVQQVVRRGSDKQFGARPMARFIQDELEQTVAKALIAGAVRSGNQVSFDGNLRLIVKS